MLLLTNAAAVPHSLEIVTTSAATLDVHASWADNNAGVMTFGSTNTAISSATTTAVVAAPAAGVVRNVKTLNVRNKDGTLSNDVTAQIDQNGTNFELHKVTLATGTVLEYVEGVGFFTIAAVPPLDVKLRVANDVVFATAASFADITGLTCPVISGRYYNFETHLYHIGNATTTGAQFGIGGVAMTAMRISEHDVITATSVVTATLASTIADVTAINTAAIAETAGAATVVMAIMSGWFNPSASGNFAIRGTSEVSVAAGLTIKQGSWARVWESDN